MYQRDFSQRGGQNFARDGHLEFVDTTQSARSTLIKRGGFAKLTWHF